MYEIKNINKSYGKKVVLDNISFTVKEGTCVGIVGPNGTGKSTLLSILAGTGKCDSGQFVVDGEDLLKNKKMLRQTVGYVPQENPLIEDLTVADNLRLWCESKKTDFMKELEEGVLKILKLKDMLYENVCNLSGGMKKRVSIGIALMNKPRILILDEPGAALDIECKNDIKCYLEKYIELGGTVIIASHDDMEIDMCTEVIHMTGTNERNGD